ncbi:MAG TPA: GntR family transcriptional regulator [Burkholderiaceae bacterium]
MVTERKNSRAAPDSLADQAYAQLKADIYDFRLLPGDRFSESDMAERLQMSRTPVREALFRLQREGYVEVLFRSGWQVRPFDFRQFEQLYDVRITLEAASVQKLCQMAEVPLLEDLKRTWLVAPKDRLTDGATVSALDERFHGQLVEATGNWEMARIHHDITERIRIIRRLDFTKEARIEATYEEHGRILEHILHHRAAEALDMLNGHIEGSKAEVRKITLHMLYAARHSGTEGSALPVS